MKPVSRNQIQTLFLTVLLAFVVIGTKGTPQENAVAVNGLMMSVSPDDTAGGPNKVRHLVVTFRNVSTEEMNIIPGTLFGCGTHAGKTNEIRLNLTDSDGKPHRRLPFLGDGPPYSAGCSGGVKFFQLVLGPAASSSVPLDLGKYFDWSPSNNTAEAKFCAGTYLIQAELTGPPFESKVEHHPRNWKGTVTSNSLSVSFDSDFASPLNDNPKPH